MLTVICLIIIDITKLRQGYEKSKSIDLVFFFFVILFFFLFNCISFYYNWTDNLSAENM